MFLPGLGADERLFKQYVEVINPKVIVDYEVSKEVSFDAYVDRLIQKIETKNPIVLGVSFGSVIAQEIKNRLPETILIVVSGIVSTSEISGVARVIPLPVLLGTIPVLNRLLIPRVVAKVFGTIDKSETELLCSIIRDTPVGYTQWAIRVLMTRKLGKVTVDYRIHGDKDWLVKASSDQVDLLLSGGHLLIHQAVRPIENVVKRFL